MLVMPRRWSIRGYSTRFLCIIRRPYGRPPYVDFARTYPKEKPKKDHEPLMPGECPVAFIFTLFALKPAKHITQLFNKQLVMTRMRLFYLSSSFFTSHSPSSCPLFSSCPFFHCYPIDITADSVPLTKCWRAGTRVSRLLFKHGAMQLYLHNEIDERVGTNGLTDWARRFAVGARRHLAIIIT